MQTTETVAGNIRDIFYEPQGRPDYMILFVTLCLLIIGTVMIYSSSTIAAEQRYGNSLHFLKRQLIYAALGIAGMFIMSRIHYQHWRKAAPVGIVLSLVLLVLVFVPGLGTTINGARRWIRVAGFTFQVSEFVKLALVVFLAHFLTKKIEYGQNDIRRMFAVPLACTVVITALILKQPDFGTAVILITVMLFIFYLAGIRLLYLLGFAAAMVPVGVLLVIFEGYRLKRIFAFLHPWDDPQGAGFHIIQSFLCFGSGGALGVGLGNSVQKLYYLPEPHTDFIFSIIGEECGFIGVLLVIILFAVLILRGFMISFSTSDTFGSLLAAGITTVIAMEVCINIAVVMGMLPTKGLVLPFVSYGGTSLVMSLAAVGILLNISGQMRPGGTNALRKTE